MIPFVIELASLCLDPLVGTLVAIMKSIGPGETKIEVLPKELEYEFEYQQWNGTFEETLQKLQKGIISSILIKPKDESKKFFCLVYAPHFQNDKSKPWYGYIECMTSYEKINLSGLCKVKGIRFISLSLEDTLDIEDMSDICYANFPWEHWRLVEACVARDTDSNCLEKIRRGPAYKRVLEGETRGGI